MSTEPPVPRLDFLRTAGGGLGALALSAIGAPRPQHTPRARRVIQIFCPGGMSHLDTFDHKPVLTERAGKPFDQDGKLQFFASKPGNCQPSYWPFRQHGESGLWMSDLLPRLATCVDDMAFIYSMQSNTALHGPGCFQMNTGNTLPGFPSMGAWVTYALGSANENLPAYVAISDPRGTPQSSVNCWGPGFLPAAFQGTDFNASKPIQNLARPAGISADADSASRAFLQRQNRRHLAQNPGDSQLAARIASYELAARMQMSVPKLSDLSSEPRSIIKLYGADAAGNKTEDLKAAYARNCILARRLIEEGVRCVQLFNGAYQTGGEGVSNWDGHKHLEKQYKVHGQVLDQPTAALLTDLKQRGLLDETLVVFCTEFGRMPTFQKGASGRDHNPDGFTAWMTGAGVKRGFSYGATDEFGWKAQQDIVSTHDFHATILHLLGLDHERLSFYHNGFERRLTQVHGHVIKDVLA